MRLRKLRVLLLSVCIVLLCRRAAALETFAVFKDPKGDDAGAGGLLYPAHGVYVPGLFDLLQFSLSSDSDHLYFDFQFAALTNPFQAPEGYFHQRLEVYVHTGTRLGRTEVEIGGWTFQTAPELGWDLRLSVAPFGETRLYAVGEENRVQVFSEGVTSYSRPENGTIRVQVSSDLLPQSDSAWGYYVLTGSFDGLAADFWRDLGEGPWQLRGEGPPVFDLLAPRFGRNSQRAQLRTGVLHPVVSRKVSSAPWLTVLSAVILLVGTFGLWRWRRG